MHGSAVVQPDGSRGPETVYVGKHQPRALRPDQRLPGSLEDPRVFLSARKHNEPLAMRGLSRTWQGHLRKFCARLPTVRSLPIPRCESRCQEECLTTARDCAGSAVDRPSRRYSSGGPACGGSGCGAAVCRRTPAGGILRVRVQLIGHARNNM